MSDSTQRWAINGLYSTSALTTGGNTYSQTYYHQYKMTLSYSVSGGGSSYSASSFSANAFSVSSPQTLTSTATGYWFDAGSSWTVTNPLTGSSPSEHWQTSQSTSGTVSVQTIAFVYNHQYQLTMATNFGTTSPAVGTNWVNAGSSVTIFAVMTNGTNERYLWAGWTGTGTGSYTGTGNNSALVTMNGAITETASWTHQYYLTVSSPYGTTSGQGWYNTGSSASFSISPTTVSGGTGIQYVFTSWSGSGNGSYNGTSSSQSVTMNNPITETANWQTQYQVTFNYQVSGGGSGYYAPSVTYYQSGSQLSVTAGPSATVWVDSGSTYTYTNNPLTGSGASERWYALSGTSGTISSSTTINPTYYHQYSLTVTASPSGAIGGNFRITYTQFGTTYTNQQQTITWNSWADASTTATVSSPQSPVASYTFSSYSPSASVTMNQAQTITLVYMRNLGNTNTGTKLKH